MVRLWSATLAFIIIRLLHIYIIVFAAIIFIFIFISALLFLLIVQISTIGIQAQTQPSVLNPKFQVERIFAGDFEPSSMVFLGADDVLVLDREEGKVFRVTHGIQSGPLLDVNVATYGYRGLLGVVKSVTKNTTNVFLYFTESATQDSSDMIQNPIDPLGNRLYRYEWSIIP